MRRLFKGLKECKHAMGKKFTERKGKAPFARQRVALFGDHLFSLPSGNALERSQKRTLLLPIRLTLIYLIFTLFLYTFGPFNWVTSRPYAFYALQVGYLLALWLGYRVGLMREYKQPIQWDESNENGIVKLIEPLLIVNLFVFLINMFRGYGLNSLDIPAFVQRLSCGILHPGSGYNTYVDQGEILSGGDVLGGNVFSAFNYIWGFVGYAAPLLGTLYLKKLRPVSKICLILYYALNLLYYLSIGTNIGVLRIILMILLPSTLRLARHAYAGKVKKKTAYIICGVAVSCVVIVLVYFFVTMTSRGGINVWESELYNIGGITVNKNSILLAILPAGLHKLLVALSAYLTQGYYGMALALNVSWTPMFGIGNSMLAVDTISNHVADIAQYTYQAKIEQFGWGSRIRWHSLYTWFANDFSFIGVILVMFVIGYLTAVLYRDAVTTKNPFAKVSIFYLCLLLIFIPCNNQLGQSIEIMFSWITVLAAWIISKSHLTPFLRRIKHRIMG